MVTMKGWKWSNGETVNANERDLLHEHGGGREGELVRLPRPGLLPDNVTSTRPPGRTRSRSSSTRPTPASGSPTTSWREITPMPMAWDVTSLGAKPGSGGCTTDSAADNWAKCKAVYTFLTAQSKEAASYATSPLWAVVDGPWKLSSLQHRRATSRWCRTRRTPAAPSRQLDAVKFVPFTDDSAEYTALKTGQVDMGYIPTAGPAARSRRLGRCRRPTRWAAATPCSRSTRSASTTPSPTSTTRHVGPMVRQLYIRQALQMVFDQPGIDKAICRGYAVPTLGAGAEHATEQPVAARPPRGERRQGPYPFSVAKAKSLLTSHGWTMQGGVMTCQDPAQVRHRHQAGPAGEVHLQLLDRRRRDHGAVADLQVRRRQGRHRHQPGRSDVQLDHRRERAVRADGPEVRRAGVRLRRLGLQRPGLRADRRAAVRDRRGVELRQLLRPEDGQADHRDAHQRQHGSFHEYATYGAQQLPFIWAPNPYAIQAVSSKLHNVTFNALYTLLPEYWYFTK